MIKENQFTINKLDPIKKQAEVSKEDRGEELSPMSPPSPYNPPSNTKVHYNDLHPYLRQLVDEHNELKLNIESFQKILIDLCTKAKSIENAHTSIKKFFRDFISEFTPHNKKEEEILFPLLAKRFLEVGEHSKSNKPITPIDVMKEEHLTIYKLATEAECAWDLMQKLFDETSRNIVFKFFTHKSNELIEVIKLHIYREDDIVLSLAQRHLRRDELDQMMKD